MTRAHVEAFVRDRGIAFSLCSVDVMTTRVTYRQELGWAPYATDHEDAKCPCDINWHDTDARTTADRHTFFKWMVKSVAEPHGLLAHAQALAAVTNPLVNSDKRLIRGAPRSGATWAPVYMTYGGNNRTQMLRLPAPGRVENRSVDGAANPYLACTAVLAAGLDGIERHLEPGQRNDDNLSELPEAELRQRGIGLLPTTLSEALDHLERDAVITEALGADYAAYDLQVKRQEWQRYHQRVSRWEIDTYLGAY